MMGRWTLNVQKAFQPLLRSCCASMVSLQAALRNWGSHYSGGGVGGTTSSAESQSLRFVVLFCDFEMGLSSTTALAGSNAVERQY